MRIACCRCDSLISASCSSSGRLLADLLFLVELGDPDGLLAGRLAGADLAELGRVGHLDGPLALGLGDADLALLLLLGHVDLAPAGSPCAAAFRPIASM